MKFIQLVVTAIFAIVFLCVFPADVYAQTQPQGDAVSFYLGPILPKNVPATDEVLNAWGFRYAYERAAGKYFELGFTMSNSENSEFRNLDLSVRADIPIQDLTAFFLAGPDMVVYQGSYYMGVHVGGGLLTHLSESTFFRTEMRFNFHPGTALLFFFGFDFHF